MNFNEPEVSKSSASPRSVGVLLIHGLTGNPSEMKPITKHLKALGYLVEVPLLAGHGGSHHDLLKSDWRQWLQSAQTVLDEMKTKVDDIYVAGLSMGGNLSLVLATQNPDIKGVVTMSSSIGFMEKSTRGLATLFRLARFFPFFHTRLYWTERAPYGIKDQRLQKMIERSIRSSKKGESSNFGLFRTYLGSFHQMDHLFQHFKKNLSKIQCPIYLLHSSEDTMVSTENAMMLYCKLPSLDKRLEYINGCDHVMTVDLRKQDVAQKIEQFIHDQQNKTSNTSCLPLSKRGAEVWMQDQNIA